MKPFLTSCLPRLSSRRICPFFFHSWGGVVLFALTISLGTNTGISQHAWGESGNRQDNGLASISTPQGSIINAEIANNPSTRAKGLMDRHSIAPDGGMLFQFPELGYWTFWMKNTKIPLDILWLDKTGTIIHLQSDVPICTRTDDHCPRYYSHKKSWQVLELKAGMAEKLELIPGSRLTITVPQNQIPY